MVLQDKGRKYWTQCTGPALDTVNAHSSEDGAPVTLFGACFCPFVQRVWVALEALGLPYHYCTYHPARNSLLTIADISTPENYTFAPALHLTLPTSNDPDEVDPYAKPADLLALSPKGLVPALKLNDYDPPKGLNESTVILNYLEDIAETSTGKSLLPPRSEPYARALAHLLTHHATSTLLPTFYRFLQAQTTPAQLDGAREYNAALEGLVRLFERVEGEVGERKVARRALGLWGTSEEEGEGEIGLIDAIAGPWLYRTHVVLSHYRGYAPIFSSPSSQSKYDAYIHRLTSHPLFAKTCSSDELYLDSYERYAFNRPNTSQVAEAINKGRELP